MPRATFRYAASLLLAGFAALPLAAATPQLDPLARQIAAFAAGGAGSGSASLKLASELSRFDKLAHFERSPALRAELEQRLAQLRGELGRAGRAKTAAAVAATGTISGRVTHDGAPVDGVRITFYTPEGYYADQAGTGADGFFARDLDAGAYLVYAEPPYSSEYSPQLYPGLDCRLNVTCELGRATRLQLAAGGQQVANFALADLGRLKGNVRARETLAPIDGATAMLFRADGERYDDTDVRAGRYEFGGIEPGEYYVVIASHRDRAGMIYRDVPCRQSRYAGLTTCPRGVATRVAVGVDQIVEGIDFDLFRGATISGRVVDRVTGAGLPRAVISLMLSAQEGLDSYQTDDDGAFTIEGLFTGSYFLQAETDGYTPQMFDRHDCTGEPYCFAGARPVEVLLGESYGGFELRLERRGTLTGLILDSRTGLGIEGVDVRVGARQGEMGLRQTSTDSAGFFSISDLPSVDLLVLARHPQYLGEYFADVDQRLGPATAQTVHIEPGQVRSLEMALAPRGRLRGRVIGRDTGQPIPSCSVLIVSAAAPDERQLVGCDSDGSFVANDLLPGGYYLTASAYYGYANYLYGKGSCNDTPTFDPCELAEGQPVQVRSGEETGPLSFPLEPGGSLSGRVVFENPGPVPALGQIRLYEEDGDEVRPRSLYGPSATYFYPSLAPGRYRLVVDGGADWESFAWDGVPCSRWYCDPRRGQAIDLESGEHLTDLDFRIATLAPYGGCTPSDTTLCLNQGRYRVKATWRDFGGASGAGAARSLTADTGYFYFFSPGNLEVMIKALDACEPRLGHHFWIYAAGLTNVEVELRVEDTLTGAVRLYSNALGETFQPILDSGAFATCDAIEPRTAAAELPPVIPRAKADATWSGGVGEAAGVELCHQEAAYDLCFGGRFAVTASYRTLGGNAGSGFGQPITPDTGAFYFFDPNNLEVVVKLLDACSTALPGYWVFASGLTDVEVELRVEDLATGRVRVYESGPGPFAPIIDLGSFPCN